MKHTKAYFDGFKYRLDKLKEGESAIYAWPEIAEYANVFAEDDMHDPETVMRYIILMYTPNSPVYKAEPGHLAKRKTNAMAILGIEPEPDGAYPEYNDMLLLRSDGMRRRVALFLMIQHSMDWQIMCHAEEELYKLMTEDFNHRDPTDAKARRVLIEETREQFQNAKERIMDADNTRAVEDAVDWFRANNRKMMRIEERIAEGVVHVLPEHAKEGKSRMD
jgi:hypothetical protein